MSNSYQLSEIFPLAKKDESHPEKIAEQYPWCSLAQLSLLQYYKKNNSARFEKQATKTALYFNNTSWLNWQLHLLSREEETVKNISEQKLKSADEFEEQNKKIQESLSAISEQVNGTEELIAFEPLHTVDYFASQGIKITEEPVTNDKLGNQMKSFTEWLKSMKKIHKENLSKGDEQTDKNIQQIAEHSNADAEIVTEAMANVLVEQNKIEKATEVYKKLSLINPSKSAYFAGKIESLYTGK